MTKYTEFQNIVDLLCWRAETHPNDLAFRYFSDGENESTQLTYAELHHKACQVAVYLQSQQLAQERILIFYPPGLDFISGFLGCLYAGAIPVPAYAPEPHRLAHTLQRLESIIQDAQSPAILSNQEILNQAQSILKQSKHNQTHLHSVIFN